MKLSNNAIIKRIKFNLCSAVRKPNYNIENK